MDSLRARAFNGLERERVGVLMRQTAGRRGSRIRLARAMAGAIALGVAGCATLPSGHPAPRDPLERFNRSVFTMNAAIDRAVLRPMARGSRRVPAPVWDGISNFVSNLLYPITLVNDLLQGKFRDTANDIARFALNSTLGVAGVLDPATAVHLARNCEDFGITLGKWGVPSGPYLVLPILGPSTLRDSLATAPQLYAYVVIPGPAIGVSLYGTDTINSRAQWLIADPLLDDAYDPYALARNVYLQRRDFQVAGTVPAVPLAENPPAPQEAAPPRDPPSCGCEGGGCPPGPTSP